MLSLTKDRSDMTRPIPASSANGEEEGLAVYVAAHPDDWDIGWGGQIIKNDVGRHPILLIIVTDGAADGSNHDWGLKNGFYKADLKIQTVRTPRGDRKRFFSQNLMSERLLSVQRRAKYLKIENVFPMNFPDGLARDFVPQIAQGISDIVCKVVSVNKYTVDHVSWHAGKEYASNAFEHPDHAAAGDATATAIQDVMLRLGLERVASRFTTIYEAPEGGINPVEYEVVDGIWSERLKVWKMMWEHPFLESPGNSIVSKMFRLGLERVASRFTTIYEAPEGGIKPVEYEVVDGIWSERLKVWKMMWEHRFLEPFRDPIFPRNPEPYVNYTFKRAHLDLNLSSYPP